VLVVITLAQGNLESVLRYGNQEHVFGVYDRKRVGSFPAAREASPFRVSLNRGETSLSSSASIVIDQTRFFNFHQD
jgi:hypothetical protein